MWNEESCKKKIRVKDDKKVQNFSFNSLVNQNKQNYVIQITPRML